MVAHSKAHQPNCSPPPNRSPAAFSAITAFYEEILPLLQKSHLAPSFHTTVLYIIVLQLSQMDRPYISNSHRWLT